MSDFEKFLVRDIVVPTGGWDFSWDEDTVTISAGTYDDILALGLELESVIEDELYTASVSFSQVGICSINIATMSSADWGGTDDALSAILGFDESETVSANTLTSSSPHAYGWYPGAITYSNNVSRGAGRTGGNIWTPVDNAITQFSGAGAGRIVDIAQKIRRRTISYDLVSRDEVEHLTRGIAALWSTHRTKRLAWYLDREDGDTDDYGTQADPDSHTDASIRAGTVDWWLVTMVSQPMVTEDPRNPSMYKVQFTINAEPGP